MPPFVALDDFPEKLIFGLFWLRVVTDRLYLEPVEDVAPQHLSNEFFDFLLCFASLDLLKLPWIPR